MANPIILAQGACGCAQGRMSRRSFLNSALGSAIAAGLPTVATANTGGWYCATSLPSDLPRMEEQEATGELTRLDDDPEPLLPLLSEQGVAFSNWRWLSSQGMPAEPGHVRLGVAFVNGPPSWWQNEVEKRARKWLDLDPKLASRISFEFGVPLKEAQIKICKTGIKNGGVYEEKSNRAALGNRALTETFDDGISTMGLYNIEATEHEFGHALCLGHEHQHEGLPSEIIPSKAIAYYAKELDWDRETTMRNVVRQRPGCSGDLSFNPASVMLYPLPPEIFENDSVPYFNTNEIHDRDRACLRHIYGVS